MSKNLVIVESPAKAKTINRILGKQYSVKASLGHIRDLPKSRLGVDVENDFTPSYVTLRNKSKVIKELRSAAKNAAAIYLAADPDREGESICFHLQELLKKETDSFFRVVFNEITKPAVLRAFEHPGEINKYKVEAQQARRILDRLVGYKLSPLLWRKVGRGLSAGRVQSVALRLVVEREREILAFVSEEYWKIAAELLGSSEPSFSAQLLKQDGKKLEVKTGDEASGIVDELRAQQFVVDKISIKPRKRNAPPPFITSSLQQEAFRKLGFAVSRTMKLAQQLYEGISLGSEGQVALITYMRTDSTRISEEAQNAARNYINGKYGDDYLPAAPPKRKKVKGAQDAHEAIRPNYVERTPESLEGMLDSNQLKLYRLIWNRFIASQMAPAKFEATTVDIKAGRYQLRAAGSRLLFNGFLAVTGLDKDKDADKLLPALSQDEELKLIDLKPTQHFTQPPARFSEAGIVKELEERGIGRPSTYATIISTIINREYVEREQGRLRPTDLGMVVTDLLTENFTDLMDYDYTARLEEVLDRIEEGNENWVAALQRFNKGFTNDLVAAEEKMRNLKREVEQTDETCEKCGSPMVIRWGRYGRFMACSEYPECNNSRPLPNAKNGLVTEEDEQESNGYADVKCEKCGSPMVLRRSRYGQFLGCSKYPECRFTLRLGKEGKIEKAVEPIPIMDCPECKEGKVIAKRSRRGKTFYGCNRYPKCKFALWKEPSPEPCPECESPYLLISRSKKNGDSLICPDENCGYTRPLAENEE